MEFIILFLIASAVIYAIAAGTDKMRKDAYQRGYEDGQAGYKIYRPQESHRG